MGLFQCRTDLSLLGKCLRAGRWKVEHLRWARRRLLRKVCKGIGRYLAICRGLLRLLATITTLPSCDSCSNNGNFLIARKILLTENRVQMLEMSRRNFRCHVLNFVFTATTCTKGAWGGVCWYRDADGRIKRSDFHKVLCTLFWISDCCIVGRGLVELPMSCCKVFGFLV